MSSFGKMMYGSQRRTSETTIGVADTNDMNEQSIDKLFAVRCQFELEYRLLEEYLKHMLKTTSGDKWLQSKFGYVTTENLAEVFDLNSFKLTDILNIRLKELIFNVNGVNIPLQFYKSKAYVSMKNGIIVLDLIGQKIQWMQCAAYLQQLGLPSIQFTIEDFRQNSIKVEDISVEFKFDYNGINMQFPLKSLKAEFESHLRRQLNIPKAYSGRVDAELLGEPTAITESSNNAGVDAGSETSFFGG